MNGQISFVPQTGVSRRWGGIFGLAFPVAVIGLALQVGFRGTTRADDLATAVLAALLFLIAAPTTWVFAFDFIEASRLTVILVGAATSLPLWYLLGNRLAAAVDGWRRWTWTYIGICGLWTAVMFGVIIALARFAS